MSKCSKTDTEKNLHTMREQRSCLASGPWRVWPADAPEQISFIKRFVAAARPFSPRGSVKIRLGGMQDGGYVMLDPGRDGLVYSFGVSAQSPWDLAMARRNFTVFQYDGSIESEPDKHPNIFFHRLFVSNEASPPRGWVNFRQMLERNGHQAERDLILQMDIEGGEWPFLESLTEDDLLRFKQLIIEFHSINFNGNRLAALERLTRTHVPIHFHYNNCPLNVFYSAQGKFIYAPLAVEISYVRRDDNVFEPCDDYFPGKLDCGNDAERDDFPIGFFDVILRNLSQP
jgi:hypothetical protein